MLWIVCNKLHCPISFATDCSPITKYILEVAMHSIIHKLVVIELPREKNGSKLVLLISNHNVCSIKDILHVFLLMCPIGVGKLLLGENVSCIGVHGTDIEQFISIKRKFCT